MKIRIIEEYDVSNIKDLDVKLAKKALIKAFKKRFHTKDNATVILVDEKRIQEINRDYRKLDKVTDVSYYETFQKKLTNKIEGYKLQIGELEKRLEKLIEGVNEEYIKC